jgi:hypothetical protein
MAKYWGKTKLCPLFTSSNIYGNSKTKTDAKCDQNLGIYFALKIAEILPSLSKFKQCAECFEPPQNSPTAAVICIFEVQGIFYFK